jgi:hypothetical protein
MNITFRCTTSKAAISFWQNETAAQKNFDPAVESFTALTLDAERRFIGAFVVKSKAFGDAKRFADELFQSNFLNGMGEFVLVHHRPGIAPGASESDGIMSTQEMLNRGATEFAGGMSSAIVDFIDGTKSAKQAMEEFAASFLESIAQMIIQQMLLNALRATGFFFGGGGMATADAMGGVHYAANGITSVSSPTYFPKFNVVAGEAGTEMLTVLARPTFRSIGGIDAVVGNAGSNRLAITNADDLANMAGGGMGGHIVIEMRGTQDFEARIVSNSIKGATVQVARDLGRNSPIAKGVKNLTA